MLDTIPTHHDLAGQLAGIFENAADLLQRDGWIQKDSTDDRGRRCAFQALVDSMPRPINQNLLHRALSALSDVTGGRSCIRWNDHYSQTETNVLSTLRFVAQQLRKE